MKLETLPMPSTDKEHIQLLEGLLARHNERIHKLENIVMSLYCCENCASGAPRERVFFGKEFWTQEPIYALFERHILKVAQDAAGSYWKTLSYVDRNGYACGKSPACDALVQTLKYPGKWFKNWTI